MLSMPEFENGIPKFKGICIKEYRRNRNATNISNTHHRRSERLRGILCKTRNHRQPHAGWRCKCRVHSELFSEHMERSHVRKEPGNLLSAHQFTSQVLRATSARIRETSCKLECGRADIFQRMERHPWTDGHISKCSCPSILD